MIAIDVADLVVIAGQALGTGPDAALDRIDLDAARAALTEARPMARPTPPLSQGERLPRPPPALSGRCCAITRSPLTASS